MSDLLDLRTVIATWHRGPCAEVRVGEHVTRYVRRGSGPSVVLLGADSQANALWESLVESLAASHRIVVPKPPPHDVDSSVWLRGFIEGLGLCSFVLIAGGSLTDAALDLATVDDFTVRRLVLLASDESALGSPSSRVLWVSPHLSPSESLRRIEEFLAS